MANNDHATVFQLSSHSNNKMPHKHCSVYQSAVLVEVACNEICIIWNLIWFLPYMIEWKQSKFHLGFWLVHIFSTRFPRTRPIRYCRLCLYMRICFGCSKSQWTAWIKTVDNLINLYLFKSYCNQKCEKQTYINYEILYFL